MANIEQIKINQSRLDNANHNSDAFTVAILSQYDKHSPIEELIIKSIQIRKENLKAIRKPIKERTLRSLELTNI